MYSYQSVKASLVQTTKSPTAGSHHLGCDVSSASRLRAFTQLIRYTIEQSIPILFFPSAYHKHLSTPANSSTPLLQVKIIFFAIKLLSICFSRGSREQNGSHCIFVTRYLRGHFFKRDFFGEKKTFFFFHEKLQLAQFFLYK